MGSGRSKSCGHSDCGHSHAQEYVSCDRNGESTTRSCEACIFLKVSKNFSEKAKNAKNAEEAAKYEKLAKEAAAKAASVVDNLVTEK